MKNLLYISLMITSLIAINELAYIGETSLAFVLIGLAIAIGLQGIYLLQNKK